MRIHGIKLLSLALTTFSSASDMAELSVTRNVLLDGPPVLPDPINDISLPDVKEHRKDGEKGIVMLSEIAEKLGFENHVSIQAKSALNVPKKLTGVLAGRYKRPFIPCVIQYGDQRVQTVFLVETGFVKTHIGKTTWDCLFRGVDVPKTTKITVNGVAYEEVSLSPQHCHFPDVNVIGSDFLSRINGRLEVDYQTGACTLVFGSI